jgi:serine/threonine protein kinase
MENILIDKDGVLKLIDMGHTGSTTEYKPNIGTREYWSPE